MIQFLLRKFLRLILVLFGATLITFLLMHAIPGNPWSSFSASPRILLGLSLDTVNQRELDRRFGLNLPLWRQFTRYVVGDVDQDGQFFCGLICGNLGPSMAQRGRSVQDILFHPPRGRPLWDSRFGFSFRLVLFSAVLAGCFGVVLGTALTFRPKSAWSRILSVSLATLISIPSFILGLLAMIVFASWLNITHVLPDWKQPADWIIPACVLAVMPMAQIARVVRAAISNTLGEDYIRTARAKGLTPARVMLVHVFRNALVPIILFLGPAFMEMFAGSFIIENLYAFPGFGREYWQAVLKLDYPMVLGITFVFAAGIGLVNLISEVSCAVLDPRMRAAKVEELL